MGLRFTLRRLMIAVAAVALAIVGMVGSRQAFWWSWRSVTHPQDWRNTQLIALADAAARAQLADWRASRERVARQYWDEAARLRAQGGDSAHARASQYEAYASATIQSMRARRFGLTPIEVQRREYLDARARLDLADSATIAIGAALVGAVFLWFPALGLRRAALRPGELATSLEAAP